MTNLTLEDRKKIAEYISELEFRTAYFADGSCCMVIDSRTIQQKIKELKTITFGDIKNQVGVRFRVKSERAQYTYRVIQYCYEESSALYLLEEESSFSSALSTIKDDTLVEVINETETN